MNESNIEAVEVTAAEAIKELASLIAGVISKTLKQEKSKT